MHHMIWCNRDECNLKIPPLLRRINLLKTNGWALVSVYSIDFLQVENTHILSWDKHFETFKRLKSICMGHIIWAHMTHIIWALIRPLSGSFSSYWIIFDFNSFTVKVTRKNYYTFGKLFFFFLMTHIWYFVGS